MRDPYDHYYFNGKLTILKPGDIIKYVVGNKYLISRSGVRILVGNKHDGRLDDAEIVFCSQEEYIAQIAKSSACYPEPTDLEEESVLKAWTLTETI